MEKPTEYAVCEGVTLDNLSAEVSNAMRDGWILHGDLVVIDYRVACSIGSSPFTFFQAMVR